MDILKKIKGTYTSNNRDRVKQIVNATKSFKTSCQNISKSKEQILVKVPVLNYETNNVEVKKVRMTREEYAFKAKTNEFRKRLRNGETIYDIMPEALAVCSEAIYREALNRNENIFPYDVQLEAASAMTSKDEYVIAEMKTGEGKTLVQVLTAYLNALESTKSSDLREWGSVHVITSNDYLAERDCSDNGRIFDILGLSSGYVCPKDMVRDEKTKNTKKNNYRSDIVYGTSTTIAADYLIDNRIYDANERMITKRMDHAIIDEADDILIDQATVPLVISGSAKEDIRSRNLYKIATDFINGKNGYRKKPLEIKKFPNYYRHRYDKFSEECAVYLDNGQVDLIQELQEEIFSLANNIRLNNESSESFGYEFYNIVEQCIKAKVLYNENDKYIVKEEDGMFKVVLLNSSTGRVMSKNKYQGGMQDAIEAKEADKHPKGKMKYTNPGKTLAKCAYSSFFELYRNGISGMTGTSDEEEFMDTYSLRTYKVPTNKKNIRIDQEDELYASIEDKHNAILEEIIKCRKTGQPVLIGTTNIEESNKIANILNKNGIKFQRLDAVNSKNEDKIKKAAGQFGCVTLATNMAGRGIDIKLGKGVKEVGGLYVISTSQNINVRVDNQLKGRAARQGDPGKTKCFMSLKDEMVEKLVNKSMLSYLIKKIKPEGNGKIVSKPILSLVKHCQTLNESKNKSSRLQDNRREFLVFKEQRKKVYNYRNKILDADSIGTIRVLADMIRAYVSSLFVNNISDEELETILGDKINLSNCKNKDREEYQKNICCALMNRIKENSKANPKTFLDNLKKKILLTMDTCWEDHIQNLDSCWDEALMSQYANKDAYKEYEELSKKEFILLDQKIAEIATSMALDPHYTIETYENNRSVVDNKNMGAVL